MSKFTEMAKVVNDKNMSDINNQITQIQADKEMLTQGIDQKLGELKMAQAQQKKVRADIATESKSEQLNKDILKAMIDGQQQGPMAIGGNVVDGFAPQQQQVASDAVGLPVIDQV